MTTPPLQLPRHTVESAPEASRDLLKTAQARYGFVPNLLGIMANAPALLEAYLAINGTFGKTSLSPVERQIILIAANFENECDYCMAAHTMSTGTQVLNPEIITALRENTPIADARLEALRAFAAETVRTRGWPSPESSARFLDAGYSPAQALEVVLGIGAKTLSNYANHLAGTPLDDAFAPARWTKPASGDARGCGCGCTH